MTGRYVVLGPEEVALLPSSPLRDPSLPSSRPSSPPKRRDNSHTQSVIPSIPEFFSLSPTKAMAGIWLLLGTSLFLLLGSGRVASHRYDTNGGLEAAAERRAENLHRLDTIILLTYITVLIVIVLTAWLFKHYRFRFIHETGVTLIYGLFIGIVLRYFNIGLLESQTFDVVTKNDTTVNEPPDYLRLGVNGDTGKTVTFTYELIEGFFADADKMKHNERKIEQKSAFSPELFFNILLPPIIFNAGYSLKKRSFFRNIGSILLFVFLGTTISCIATAVLMFIFTRIFGMGFAFQELLFFGALISATDPITVLAVLNEKNVEANLYALIFGESAMNDAVAIVLSATIDSYTMTGDTVDLLGILSAGVNFVEVFVGSLLLGSVIGCANAILTKFTYISDHPLLESALFILISYCSFLIAEIVHLTGIVAVLFCGICQAHYTFNNLSVEAQTTTKRFFQLVSFLSEAFIFCYIGISVFVGNNQKWNILFIICALISITLARAIYVYPLCELINIQRRPPIPKNYQHMILFSGLRGAMAFALADRNTATENRQVILAATVAIVLFTVFFNGGLASWMIDYLGIKHGVHANEEERTITSSTQQEVADYTTTSSHSGVTISSTPGHNPWDKAFLPRKWYNFDANFMKPLLTHATPPLTETLPSICYPLAKMLTSDRQLHSHQPLRMRFDSESGSCTMSNSLEQMLS
ncbi:hypothetical protein PENTCL1PPCAC_26490 [Pristionchus entomophagus]|uniref:Sodium/hydrogen exchanger n=1 Tax=Pristionchus entomophagus TaxID=358040 RepID=A0AAV5UBM2_9BILA|nr:hypothetical protein PENTCL1PPCAC_26490 [Pristionchus entomophagus]